MLKKKLITYLMIGVFILGLCGCTSSEISSMESLSLDEVQSKRVALSISEREGQIYQYVADRITVDSTKLMKIEAKDADNINNLCSKINEALSTGDTTYISAEHLNYLLTEFLKTPYEWQQANVSMVGFDPASRLYFVDVTYNTAGVFKQVIPSSSIPKGVENEALLKTARKEQWDKYLDQAYRNNSKATELYNNFVQVWGNPMSIMEDQQGVSLLQRTSALNNGDKGIGKLTYTGLLDNGYLANNSATMTFRFILKYKYNLGEETDLAINALYLKNFEVQPEGGLDAFLNKFVLNDATGVEVLRPFVDETILSYNKAVEEFNYVGLYSLFSDFAKHDKYYEMLQNYAYVDTDAYTYRIIEKTGTSLLVRVDRVNKIRAKGESMSMPTYDEILIFDMVLDTDDTIRIKGVYPMRITLSGEPLSIIKNVSGISDLIQYEGVTFTDTNKKLVEEAVAKFGQVVISGSTDDNPDFLKSVDLGISQSTLQQMMQNIVAIDANKKVTYVISWDTQTNIYCSLTLREIFETAGGCYDTEAVVDVAKSNGEWKVVGYNRLLNVKTSNSTFDENTALCVNYKDGTITYGKDYGKSETEIEGSADQTQGNTK